MTAPRTPIRLRNLQIDEGSIVDDGANPLARVVFFKRRPEGTVEIAKAADEAKESLHDRDARRKSEMWGPKPEQVRGKVRKMNTNPAAEELTAEMLETLPDDLRRVIAQNLAIKDLEIANLRQQTAQAEAQHVAEIKALTPQMPVPGAPPVPGQPPMPGQPPAPGQPPGAQLPGQPAQPGVPGHPPTQPGQPPGAQLPNGAPIPGATVPGSTPQQPPGVPGKQEGAPPMNAKDRDLEGGSNAPPGPEKTDETPDGPIDPAATEGAEGSVAAGAETPAEESEEEKAKKAAIFKRMPEAVRLAITKRDREIVELRKSLANEIEVRKRREYEDEANKKFTAIPLPRIEIAKALRSADEAGAECGATVRRAFETVNAIAREGISVVAKRNGRDLSPRAHSAHEKIEAAVIEIRKSRPSITREQALGEAYVKHPDLYMQIRSAASTD